MFYDYDGFAKTESEKYWETKQAYRDSIKDFDPIPGDHFPNLDDWKESKEYPIVKGDYVTFNVKIHGGVEDIRKGIFEHYENTYNDTTSYIMLKGDPRKYYGIETTNLRKWVKRNEQH